MQFLRINKSLALGMVALITIGSATTAGLSWAQQNSDNTGGQSKMHHGNHKRCLDMDALSLSPEQQEKLRALKEQMKGSHEGMKAKKQQWKALKEAGKGDTPEAVALKNEMKAAWKARAAEHERQVATILTPEQMVKWRALKEQCHQMHKQGKPDGTGANR